MISQITLGAGCFWCIEACFNDVEGILSVKPGYSGGEASNANYRDVCTGGTEHVEVARVEFDDKLISFDKLLEMFWFVHDPTQLNRQGNDIGSQYRSAIFYHNDDQAKIANAYKEKLSEQGVWADPIVTIIEPLKNFFPAEDYHHNYYENNPDNGYCQFVVRPKIEKFREVFASLTK